MIGGEMMGGGLDADGARTLARRIFETYDNNRSGVLEPPKIAQMMVDTYNTINKEFTPSEYDVESYIKTLDKNKDGRVTLSDVEETVLQLMCNERV